MRTLCYSVRLKEMCQVSPKCWAAKSFDGSDALIPSSQVFGRDLETSKSDAWWISAWILKKRSLQYSSKKSAFFYNDTKKRASQIKITRHVPEKIQATPSSPHDELTK